MATRPPHSSYRDRTNEFRSAVESARKQFNVGAATTSASASASGSRLEGSKAVASIQSEFNRRASKIGLGIHQTSEKLARLAKLAKRTSVFDDPTKDIQDLTAIIKKDIGALSAAVADLQHLRDSQNESGNISRDTSSHSTTVIDNLKNRLMSTTNEFKDVLTMRTENMKVHEDRRKLFSATAGKEPANPFIRQRPIVSKGNSSDAAAPPAPWATDSSASAPLFPRSTLTNRKKGNGDPSSSTQPLMMQQQQQLAVQQDSYMQSRAEALQNVESTIHELSNIFTQLATMVSQQGEIAIRFSRYPVELSLG